MDKWHKMIRMVWMVQIYYAVCIYISLDTWSRVRAAIEPACTGTTLFLHVCTTMTMTCASLRHNCSLGTCKYLITVQANDCLFQTRISHLEEMKCSEPTLKTSQMGNCHGFIGWECTLNFEKDTLLLSLPSSADEFHIKAFLRQVCCQHLVRVRLAWATQCRALDAAFSPPPRQKHQ